MPPNAFEDESQAKEVLIAWKNRVFYVRRASVKLYNRYSATIMAKASRDGKADRSLGPPL